MTHFLQLFRAWQRTEAAAVTADRRLRKVVRNALRGGEAPSASLLGEAHALRADAAELLEAMLAAGTRCPAGAEQAPPACGGRERVSYS